MPLLLFGRSDLGAQAMTALIMMQAPLRNLLDGDGSEVISQALVARIMVFLGGLSAAASDSLHDGLNAETMRLGPLQELAGLSMAAAAKKAIGDSITTHVDDNRILRPKGFVLQQNYPKPLNPSTQIRYHLPQAAHVELAIYDIQGRKIKTLVDEIQAAGEKAVVWNGADAQEQKMASGIYFYRLSAGAFRETQKMILRR